MESGQFDKTFDFALFPFHGIIVVIASTRKIGVKKSFAFSDYVWS